MEQILYKRNEDVLMAILQVFFGGFWRWIGTLIILCIIAEIPASIIRAIKGQGIKQIIKLVTGEKNGN